MLSYEHVSKFLLFLDGIEIVNNNSYKKVDNELGTNDHESNKVDNSGNIGIFLWL